MCVTSNSLLTHKTKAALVLRSSSVGQQQYIEEAVVHAAAPLIRVTAWRLADIPIISPSFLGVPSFSAPNFLLRRWKTITRR